ncbi:MAG: hypothetical protein M0Q29_09465 [Thiopseudomonas sp.]|nr:hypothetical protein [Thiopseudomonas sp.]
MTEDDLRHLAETQRLLEESMQSPKPRGMDSLVLLSLKACGVYMTNGDLMSFSKRLFNFGEIGINQSLAKLIDRGLVKKCRFSKEAKYKITQYGASLIGSKKTSQTVKYFAIESAQK